MNVTHFRFLKESLTDISCQTALLFTDSQTDYYSSQMNDSLYNSPEQVLKKVFGYDSFRGQQRQIIQNVLDGRDTLAIMPTGGGKSLCYQIPALLLNGLTVVISPLIALMQDQVSQLEVLGIPAVFLNSSLDWEDYIQTSDKIRKGLIKLLYISPEALNTQRIQDLLHSSNVNVKCITIDEAHCISSWGHDFRKDYLEIAAIRKQFSNAVCLALTATATNQVRKDIVELLNMENPSILLSSFNRPNLYIEVRKKENPVYQVIQYINEHKEQSGIIYCFSRKQVDDLTMQLQQKGIKALNYHAGLTDEQRTEHQKDFINDKVNVMVATVAFGMGINKSDVRYVIHFDLPKSVEQYYQEIGRAGRDGLPAQTLLLFSLGDIHKIRYFFNEKEDSTNDEKLLQGMIDLAQSKTCLRQKLLNYFGEPYENTDNEKECCCSVCSRGPIESKDVTIPAQKFMSCILRAQERYGASYIIDILLGSKKERILENNHDKLTTYGIGKELCREDWFELCSCLYNAGLIEKTKDYSILYLTPSGHQILRQRAQINLPVQFTGGKKNINLSNNDLSGLDAVKTAAQNKDYSLISKELRIWRKKTAEHMKVAPFVIFGDKTLIEIATKKPESYQELIQCYGIGEQKAEKFGKEIIEIVKNNSIE